ncbi:unnamed protein product [Allacma fusca]|uniref:Metalloendopeptidase n=1 Tax=Allacma fusca TaxID=39272 RepID=A0A8J2J722_9HEXA|nr:unnamed protein product [Allacma fusca]
MNKNVWTPVLLVASFCFQLSAGIDESHSNSKISPIVETYDLLSNVPAEPFSPTDYQNADGLMNYGIPKESMDPIELAGLYEGDIVLDKSDRSNDNDTERNAIMSDRQKWSGGIIPYFISSQFSSAERSVIARAFLEYQRQTCIVFRPRTTERDYIHIVKGSGCSSQVGRTGGGQAVTLGDGCVYPGIAIHELMHAVGFWHEQSRFDRDDYVTVYFNNINPGMEFNFRKYRWGDIQSLGISYDTASIMHYGAYAFSRDRRYPTIVPKTPNRYMGQRDGFSAKDIIKINRLYQCNTPEATTSASQITTISPWQTTTSKPVSERCVDSHHFCQQWSWNGECKRNPSWMINNCKKSCSSCEAPCSDSNQYCGVWASRGECIRNPDYMRTYCAKSCNSCAKAK